MILFSFLFWISIIVIVYVYFGYPALLLLLSKLKRKPPIVPADDFEPSISLIIAAHNEEQVIAQKLENSLALDYPTGKMEIIVASDGSVDNTNAIVDSFQFAGVKLNASPIHKGKASIQNDTIPKALGEIIVFSDGTGIYNREAIKELASCFSDPKVGCVCGLVAYSNTDDSSTAYGEGLYWKYELFIRQMESDVGNLAMGSGSILAFRRELFETLDPAVSDDFVIPITVVQKGYRVVYEPKAVSIEQAPTQWETELKTKIRTITLDLRGLFRCKAILNPFKYPLHSLGLISHKLFRWLIPYFLIVAFICNVFLRGRIFYDVTLLLQVFFYLSAYIGYVLEIKSVRSWLLKVPFTFCLINLAALIGVYRYLSGQTFARWEPVR